MTASLLLHDVYAVKRGDIVLVHASAGGVGPDPLSLSQGAWCDGHRDDVGRGPDGRPRTSFSDGRDLFSSM
jgi:hypothetical protein